MPTKNFHYVEHEPSMLGAKVQRRYSKRVIKDEWHVHIKWLVDGIPVHDEFLPMDTDAGREAMAHDCVSPDMLRAE